jgi:hypothetical protein
MRRWRWRFVAWRLLLLRGGIATGKNHDSHSTLFQVKPAFPPDYQESMIVCAGDAT